jgi:LPXTG-motif cell wall-anchored protein
MIRRTMLVVAVVATLTALGAPRAEAQPYPPGGFFIAFSVTTVVPGQTITISGSMTPGATSITFVFASTPTNLGSVTPAADGTFSADVTIPTDATAGSHTITATDSTGLEITGALTVVSSAGAGAGAGAGGLPRTGDQTSIPLTRLAALLVAAGGAALFVARRRRASLADATDRPTAGVGS